MVASEQKSRSKCEEGQRGDSCVEETRGARPQKGQWLFDEQGQRDGANVRGNIGGMMKAG